MDGSDALAKLDGRKVHLIVSDVNMPNLSQTTQATASASEQLS